jgi:hypothetical protein
MRIVVFDDEPPGGQIQNGLKKNLAKKGLSYSVEWVQGDFYSGAMKWAREGGKQAWLIDIRTQEVRAPTEVEPLDRMLKEEQDRDPAFRELSRKLLAMKEGPFFGISVALIARQFGIPFRFVSHAIDLELPLIAYLLDSDKARPDTHEVAFIKGRLATDHPLAADVRDEFDRVINWVLGIEQGGVPVRGTGKISWRALWPALLAVVGLLAGLTKLDEWREKHFVKVGVDIKKVEVRQVHAPMPLVDLIRNGTAAGVTSGDEVQVRVDLSQEASVGVLTLEPSGKVGWYKDVAGQSIFTGSSVQIPPDSLTGIKVGGGGAAEGFLVIACNKKDMNLQRIAGYLEPVWSRRGHVTGLWEVGDKLPPTKMGGASSSYDAESVDILRSLESMARRLMKEDKDDSWRIVIFPVR